MQHIDNRAYYLKKHTFRHRIKSEMREERTFDYKNVNQTAVKVKFVQRDRASNSSEQKETVQLIQKSRAQAKDD
jgi:hypothetical protein